MFLPSTQLSSRVTDKRSTSRQVFTSENASSDAQSQSEKRTSYHFKSGLAKLFTNPSSVYSIKNRQSTWDSSQRQFPYHGQHPALITCNTGVYTHYLQCIWCALPVLSTTWKDSYITIQIQIWKGMMPVLILWLRVQAGVLKSDSLSRGAMLNTDSGGMLWGPWEPMGIISSILDH